MFCHHHLPRLKCLVFCCHPICFYQLLHWISLQACNSMSNGLYWVFSGSHNASEKFRDKNSSKTCLFSPRQVSDFFVTSLISFQPFSRHFKSLTCLKPVSNLTQIELESLNIVSNYTKPLIVGSTTNIQRVLKAKTTLTAFLLTHFSNHIKVSNTTTTKKLQNFSLY